MDLKNASIPYSDKDLFAKGKPSAYSGRQLDNIAFPLGGLGTGSISLGGWGQLRDLEIFNRPAKGTIPDNAFFTLHAHEQNRKPVTKVLQGPIGGSDFTGLGAGLPQSTAAGLSRFQEATFSSRFPFAKVTLSDEQMPLAVSLEAFNPFIPLKADDSGLPAALFIVHLENPGQNTVDATLFANLQNACGGPRHPGRNEFFAADGVSGITMSPTGLQPDSPRYAQMALATPHEQLQVQTHWYRGAWFDSLSQFWQEATTGQLSENREPAEAERGEVASLGLQVTLQPGDSVALPVWILWHAPTFEMYWSKEDQKPTWRNYYATVWEDLAEVADYLANEYPRLLRGSRQFSDALYASTLPAPVMDAVTSQLAILKSTTCLRLEDGTFYAFEGCNPTGGCCEGSCTHVWNYAQALPYLFPELERSMRDADYAHNLHHDGQMTFRLPLPKGKQPDPSFYAAADGQLGGIMKVYREWLICGDDEWLRRLWPSVKKSLAYAWQAWDKDRDGVMEAVQHNTYDVEFHGPNTMTGSFYLGALRAAEEMARHLGENEQADDYRQLFEKGRAWMDAALFNGEYYEQQIVPAESCDDQCGCHGFDPAGSDPSTGLPKYQYGKGCLSDQLIGQWFARLLQLGDLFDGENVTKAMAAVYQHNWQQTMANHDNPQRVYALNDEAGLLLCTWPRGERPGLPIPYSDEVWCGIEYQVASHLIYEGLIEEGLAIVKAVRDRHDGTRRNPWNEFECGNHYARSLASWSLLPALANFFYAASSRSLSFTPRIYKDNFACLFSVDSGWGMLRQKKEDDGTRMQVALLAGSLDLANLQIGFRGDSLIAAYQDESLHYESYPTHSGSIVRLLDPITLKPGERLTLHTAAEEEA